MLIKKENLKFKPLIIPRKAYDIELRNTPAGVKARDILSGKYKKVDKEKVLPFAKAPQDAKENFSPVKLPSKCISDYNTKAKTAGAILVSFLSTYILLLITYYFDRGILETSSIWPLTYSHKGCFIQTFMTEDVDNGIHSLYYCKSGIYIKWFLRTFFIPHRINS